MPTQTIMGSWSTFITTSLAATTSVLYSLAPSFSSVFNHSNASTKWPDTSSDILCITSLYLLLAWFDLGTSFLQISWQALAKHSLTWEWCIFLLTVTNGKTENWSSQVNIQIYNFTSLLWLLLRFGGDSGSASTSGTCAATDGSWSMQVSIWASLAQPLHGFVVPRKSLALVNHTGGISRRKCLLRSFACIGIMFGIGVSVMEASQVADG